MAIDQKISTFFLDIGNERDEDLISYKPVLEHLETAHENVVWMDQELFKFRVIIDTKGL